MRIIHACGMIEVADDIVFSPGAAEAASMALRAGAPILCDANMVAHGVTRARLPANNEVICMLADPRVAGLAIEAGNTRSAAALELWGDRLDGAVVAIGNAPTALFRLLEMLDAGSAEARRGDRHARRFCRRGGIQGNAARRWARSLYFGRRGRKGGSAMAAAAINALASEKE